jgi:4-azaleucine resistance transporter AzlC
VAASEVVRRGFPEGLRASVPVVGYLPAAMAFGVATRGAGLSTAETLLMSLIVYSGASQFALVGLAAAGTSWFVMAAISLVLGVRHMLYGPSLAPHLGRMGTGRAAVAALGLTDEVFAVASVKLGRRPPSAELGWLLGLETGAYVSWGLGTWIGGVAGTVVIDVFPSLAPTLSFALPALFVALLVSLVKRKARRLGPCHIPSSARSSRRRWRRRSSLWRAWEVGACRPPAWPDRSPVSCSRGAEPVRTEFLLLFLVVGAGNYLMRFLPLLWALRREEAQPRGAASGRLGGLLPFVGPSVVVALLVTSVLSEARDEVAMLRIAAALLPTLVVAVRFGNLGLTVLVGVSAYWLVSLVI